MRDSAQSITQQSPVNCGELSVSAAYEHSDNKTVLLGSVSHSPPGTDRHTREPVIGPLLPSSHRHAMHSPAMHTRVNGHKGMLTHLLTDEPYPSLLCTQKYINLTALAFKTCTWFSNSMNTRHLPSPHTRHRATLALVEREVSLAVLAPAIYT